MLNFRGQASEVTHQKVSGAGYMLSYWVLSLRIHQLERDMSELYTEI